MHVRNLGSPSFSRRWKSWPRMSGKAPASISVTKHWQWLRNSSTSDQLSPTTPPLTQSLTSKFGGHWYHGKLSKSVWENNTLTTTTKIIVYWACVLSILLYSNESWLMYTHWEQYLNSFHLCCLWCILGISWKGHVPNQDILELVNFPPCLPSSHSSVCASFICTNCSRDCHSGIDLFSDSWCCFASIWWNWAHTIVLSDRWGQRRR